MGDAIFISYRREDSRSVAGRIYDRLSERWPADQIFMDVDSIGPGVDFLEFIRERLAASKVALVVIGPRWLDARDEEGRRRLDQPGDYVRLEVAEAIRRDLHVIPLLVEGAALPAAEELPDDLKGLRRHNAFEIRHERFRHDVDLLERAIRSIISPRRSARWPVVIGLAALLAAGGGAWWLQSPVPVEEGAEATAFALDLAPGNPEALELVVVSQADGDRWRIRVSSDTNVSRIAETVDRELILKGVSEADWQQRFGTCRFGMHQASDEMCRDRPLSRCGFDHEQPVFLRATDCLAAPTMAPKPSRPEGRTLSPLELR